MLQGTKALITGASRGIGSVIANKLAAEKASLILADKDVKGLEEVKQACKPKGAGDVHFHSADFSDMSSVDAMTRTVLQQHGAIDLLVNNAGAFCKPTLPEDNTPINVESPLEGDLGAWSACMAINLHTPMRLTRAFSPQMAAKKQGTIINISSFAGHIGVGPFPVYAASKWALRGWSKSCYEALRPHGIKVSCIAPDLVQTHLVDWVQANQSNFLRQEDVAEACMLVIRCSPNAVPEELIIRAVQPYW